LKKRRGRARKRSLSRRNASLTFQAQTRATADGFNHPEWGKAIWMFRERA
jgi:hypothetical protein